MIVLNIKKEDIKFTQHKNGNHYATIVVEKKKDVDKYGNDHTVYNGQTATERAEKAKKEYCGNGKEYVWEAKKEFAQNKQELEPNDENLPF
jgi:DNA-directed RNA polymerase subunit M/transcription elongation factor TFIIS